MLQKKKIFQLRLLELDVDKEESIVSAVKKITDERKNGCFVNNAGYGQFGCTEDVSVDDFRKQFETNFFSIVRIIQGVSTNNEKSKFRNYCKHKFSCWQNGITWISSLH